MPHCRTPRSSSPRRRWRLQVGARCCNATMAHRILFESVITGCIHARCVVSVCYNRVQSVRCFYVNSVLKYTHGRYYVPVVALTCLLLRDWSTEIPDLFACYHLWQVNSWRWARAAAPWVSTSSPARSAPRPGCRMQRTARACAPPSCTASTRWAALSVVAGCFCCLHLWCSQGFRVLRWCCGFLRCYSCIAGSQCAEAGPALGPAVITVCHCLLTTLHQHPSTGVAQPKDLCRARHPIGPAATVAGRGLGGSGHRVCAEHPSPHPSGTALCVL
jgi:hypothetical protein